MKARANDWLASHVEKGQSVKTLQRKSFKAWPHATYDTINIVPCGLFIEGQSPPLDKLRELMELWFCCKCVVSKHVSLEKVAVNGLVDDEQLLVKDAANYLKKLHPGRSIFANIMVTMVDLTPGEGWNFVFGQASLSEGWGVFSFARFNPNFYKYMESQLTKKQQQEMLRRACRTMVHEVGHILGFKHCIYYHCLMNGSNGDHEVSPFKLCPICLQKLYIAMGTNYKSFDLQKRYENLKAFYVEQQWKKEIDWINIRLGLAHDEKDTHVVETKVQQHVDDNNVNFEQKYEEACEEEKATYISIKNNGISRNKDTKNNNDTFKNCSSLNEQPETAAEVLTNINKMMTSLKATQRSLEATSKKIEENNHAYDLEEKWNKFQETYEGLNERLINNIEQALKTDTKMRKLWNNHKKKNSNE
eukprot:g7003.t1